MSAPSLTPTRYPEPECRSCRALLDGRGLCPSCDRRAVRVELSPACPDCGRAGCDGGLENCWARWR
ncbi:hypothetical protein [Deinococcus petrolearius]|uniref:DZANK-type domain-containing protein n=1 Tax=Deinococcus petrolearius TaxID=1751295 RepID=A0ABW1DF42_9DEIO